MSSGPAIYRSSTVGKRLIQASWLQSGKCVRCLHSTRQYRAEDRVQTNAPTSVEDEGVSPRRRRTAAIADELLALARAEPSSKERKPQISNGEARRQPVKTTNPRASSTAQSISPTAHSEERDMQITRHSPRVEGRQSKHASGVPYIDAKALLKEGAGTATIAGRGGYGVVGDRLRLIKWRKEAGQHKPKAMVRISAGLPLTPKQRPRQSSDASEQDSTIAEKRRTYSERRLARKAERSAGVYKETPVDAAQRTINNRLIAGEHAGSDLFGGKEKFKQSTLNEVARAMTLNPSYLAQDTARFVNKVRSLLPAVMKPRANRASTPQT